MLITGNTRLFAILADPIAQVRTPEVLNAYFAEHHVDGVLVPMHVPADKLAITLDAIRGMKNMGGCIITVPHKNAVAELCDVLGPTAKATGAVNTVRRLPDGRLYGDMFDGAGFVSGLISQGHDPKGKRVLLVGAGGASGAIAFALVQAGVGELVITNRTLSKAEEIATRIKSIVADAPVRAGDSNAQGYDIVVNATSLGMRPDDALPLDVNTIASSTLVAEIIMKPALTPLLDAAQQKGCTVHFGRHMLDEQVRLMAEFMLDTADHV